MYRSISRLDIAEEGIGILEDMSIKIIQTEIPKDKSVKEQSSYDVSNTLTYRRLGIQMKNRKSIWQKKHLNSSLEFYDINETQHRSQKL